jgi:cytochrome c oxidase cbb3-type subunit 3
MKALALLVLAGCCWSLAALAAEIQAASTLAQGESLYQRHCAVCHGRDGHPDTAAGRLLSPRVRSFSDPVEMARMSFDRMYRAIKEGRPGTAMAPWSTVLSDIEIAAVIDYIHTLAPASAGLIPYQVSLELGERLYRRSCVVCHGENGQAETEAARMLEPPPTRFADPVVMARVDDGRMYLAITKGRPGTAMSSWEHAMAPAEIIDLMRYIRTLAQPRPPGMGQLELDLTVGGQIYARHCVECHGSTGSGRTPLTEGLGRFPRNFGDAGAMRSVTDDALRQTIIQGRPGTAMAPWRGILNEEDIRRVILYIRRTFQRQS